MMTMYDHVPLKTNTQFWRIHVKFFGKTLGLLLAGLALTSCGGGGSSGGAFGPPPPPPPPQDSTLSISATSTTLPVNTQGHMPSEYGNPSQATVSITWRNPDGSLITGKDIDISIAPVTVAALSCLVDGTCTDANQLFGNYIITGSSGQAQIFVNAGTIAGTATLVASGVDPTTQKTVSASLVFTVTSGVGPMPASVQVTASPTTVYMSGASGAATTSTITAQVLDGGGQIVPDPVTGNSGYDNVRFSILDAGHCASGASLSTNSVAGSVSGTTVDTHTVRGQATAAFSPGTTPCQLQIQATVDAADNNVTNGISQPRSATVAIAVSDGILYSLVFAIPTDGIAVNSVLNNISSDTTSVPSNGLYSLTVMVMATDRRGNPVPAGTNIQFGIVDAPLSGFPSSGPGTFPIAGNDGIPQVGGTLFTAQTLRTAGGNAGPGDTLLVFGQQRPGYGDLESARQIASVNGGNASLIVTYPFNPNDTSGVSVPVTASTALPYVIGRAQEANIVATSAATDPSGIATTTLTYPSSRLGKNAYIWARGTGSPFVVDGTRTTRLVTTTANIGLPGVAPGTLVTNTTPLQGNTTTTATVCLYDANHEPIQGTTIGFNFSNLGATGTGTIDGQTGPGALAPTGTNGCTSGQVRTSGIAGSGSPAVTFSTDDPLVQPLLVPIAAPGNPVLQASPSSLIGSGTVTLQLSDANGNPIAGAAVTVNCSAGVNAGLVSPTGADGRTTASIDASGLKGSGTGTCTFAVGNGVSATVNIQSPGNPILQVSPSFLVFGGTYNSQQGVTLLLTDPSGTPISGAAVSAVCQGGLNVGFVSPTGNNGRTAATIDGTNLLSGKTGSCTFSSDGVSAVVNAQAIDATPTP